MNITGQKKIQHMRGSTPIVISTVLGAQLLNSTEIKLT
jgi:hypothetical protein